MDANLNVCMCPFVTKQDWTKNPNGGVFRHQCPEGYGVFYLEADSTRTKFVVTASKSHPSTNPRDFCRELMGVFNDINSIIHTHLQEKEEAQVKATGQ